MRVFSTLSETFCSSVFPEEGEVVRIRVAVSKKIERAILRYDDYTGLMSDDEMSYLGFFDNAHFYEGRMQVAKCRERLSYFFILFSEKEVFYYAKNGLRRTPPRFSSRFIIVPSLDAPSWVSDVTCYQIFPDRFCNGDETNDVRTGEYSFDGGTVTAKNFDEDPEDFNISRCLDFYNGDLKGIEEKLDYLKELGISMLYINPVFSSMTVHRYDAIDFFNVDKKLGGNEALASLVEKAHEKGIKILLDISINHVGTASLWYREALEGKGEAAAFFTRNEDGSIKYWNGVETLADLDYHSEKLRDIIYRGEESAMKKFLRPPFSIDGWRLDVAPEVARTEDESLCLDVWRDVRFSLKAEKRDLYLVGEGWDDSEKYLDTSAWDSTMNYFGSSRIFRMLLGEEDRFLTKGWGFPPKEGNRISAREASIAINDYLNGNLDQNVYFMMNLIDSHDTPRLHLHEAVMNDERYLSLVMALYMLPGFPSIYYGDEIKISGRINSVEGSRYPMCWDEEKWNQKYLSWHRMLGAVRGKEGFGKSAFYLSSIGEDVLIMFRYLNDETLVAVMNFSPDSITYTLDPFMMKGPNGSLILGSGCSDGYAITVKGGRSALFSFKTC